MSTISPVFPLEDAGDGTFRLIDIKDITTSVDQNIKMVLLTRKGEKIGRPTFGVGLHEYLFEFPSAINNGSSNKPPLRENIIRQLNTYIPYIKLQNVS